MARLNSSLTDTKAERGGRWIPIRRGIGGEYVGFDFKIARMGNPRMAPHMRAYLRDKEMPELTNLDDKAIREMIEFLAEPIALYVVHDWRKVTDIDDEYFETVEEAQEFIDTEVVGKGYENREPDASDEGVFVVRGLPVKYDPQELVELFTADGGQDVFLYVMDRANSADVFKQKRERRDSKN